MQTADPERMKFAYPGVMEGNLSGCSWDINQPCTAPMTGSDCYAVKCDSIDYSCPPAGQETCPAFTGTSCGKVPGESKPYWMHKCNPLALPTRDKVTMLTCNATADVDGSFQCYFSQVRGCQPPISHCDFACIRRSGAGVHARAPSAASLWAFSSTAMDARLCVVDVVHNATKPSEHPRVAYTCCYRLCIHG